MDHFYSGGLAVKKYKGVTPRGNSIQVSFTWNGTRYRETLRWAPTPPNLKQASRLREKVIYEIDRGSYSTEHYLNDFPNSRNAAKQAGKLGSNMLIGPALDQWLHTKEPYLEKSTYRDYASSIRYHLIPRFGACSVSEVVPSEIKEWLQSLNISNKRKNNILVPFRQCFKDLFYDGLIDINPLERVPNLAVHSREPEPFNSNEVERILNSAQNLFGYTVSNLFQFAFNTGLRTSELIALRWAEVDFERNRIEIKRAKVRESIKAPKTRSGLRFVDLNNKAIDALLSQYNLDHTIDEVFWNPLTSLAFKDDQQIRKSFWKPSLKDAGIPYRTPYQTRHTYASTLLSNGAQPLYVAHQMGHSDWGMIRKVYGKWIQNNE